MNILIKFIPLIFIAFDIISGVLAALKNGCLDSAVMREGLYNKSGEIIALVLSYALEKVSVYYSFAADFPLYGVTSAYICGMEILSTIENICELSPRMFNFFKPYLAKLNGYKKE